VFAFFLYSTDIHDIQRFSIFLNVFSEFWLVGPIHLSFVPKGQISSYATD